MALVKNPNPRRQCLQHCAVVAHKEDRSLVFRERILECFH